MGDNARPWPPQNRLQCRDRLLFLFGEGWGAQNLHCRGPVLGMGDNQQQSQLFSAWSTRMGAQHRRFSVRSKGRGRNARPWPQQHRRLFGWAMPRLSQPDTREGRQCEAADAAKSVSCAPVPRGGSQRHAVIARESTFVWCVGKTSTAAARSKRWLTMRGRPVQIYVRPRQRGERCKAAT
jgi:hypothetical protein